MAPYLPRDGHAGSPYSEGGALYALGLITANHGSGIQPFLTESLRATGNPIIQHGACLGLGEYWWGDPATLAALTASNNVNTQTSTCKCA